MKKDAQVMVEFVWERGAPQFLALNPILQPRCWALTLLLMAYMGDARRNHAGQEIGKDMEFLLCSRCPRSGSKDMLDGGKVQVARVQPS